MRLLLDTKVLLWTLQDYSSLGIETRLKMKAADVIYVSAASILEVRVKEVAGKLTLHDELVGSLMESGFTELPLKWEQAEGIVGIDLDEGDVFDRVLLAQAQEEQLVLVTADDVLLKAYPNVCMDGRK